MVKIQRLFAKTDLKIQVCGVDCRVNEGRVHFLPFNVNNVKKCVDMFPKTTGVETELLIYLETCRFTLRRLSCFPRV